jgi:hypothetical protein
MGMVREMFRGGENFRGKERVFVADFEEKWGKMRFFG